jgi:very-short-patch-repair endonuclease
MPMYSTGDPVKDNRLTVPAEEMVKLFDEGTSVLGIARKYSCSRGAVCRRLEQAGRTPRGCGESQTLRWERAPVGEGQRITAAAHVAARGRRHTFEEMRNRADCRQRLADPTKLKGHERAFYDLASPFLKLVPQLAVGPYNLDFSVADSPIAVEIFGGGWHLADKHIRLFNQRSPYIRDAGFSVVAIWCCKKQTIDRRGVDYVRALVDQARGDKTVLREQYVICGDGQPATTGSRKLNYLTGVMSFEHGIYVISVDD